MRALFTPDTRRNAEFRDADNTSARTPPAVIDLATAYRAYGGGARFVDVREPEEWAAGHIDGAVHHPVGDIEARPRLEDAADTPVVTYCRSGPRAARAAATLSANGYRDVRVLAGGYDDWQRAGYPVRADDDVE